MAVRLDSHASQTAQQTLSQLPTRLTHPMLVHMCALGLRVVEKLDSQSAQSTTASPTDIATALDAAVAALRTFVGTFRKTSKFVFHLASMRRMFMDLEVIGGKLEEVMAMAGVKESDVADPDWKGGDWTWRKQLQADRDQQEAELAAQAAKNALPFARSMRPHEPMEALTLLKFEIDNFKADNSKVHVNSMKKVFFSVVRSSNGRVARIPEWYIPPYALSYDRKEAMEGSVGNSYHGQWVDRKSKAKSGEQSVVSRDVVVTRVEIHVDAIETFRKEVEMWFNLQHDNVLKLYGASHCSWPAILVTEEASNGPLARYVREKNQLSSVWSLFLEAAKGLQFLHEKKIVHGNLKSNNILMTTDHHVKLADFGLGMLMLQNQMIQDTVVEQRKQAAYKEKAARGLKVKEPPAVHVKPFNDMGWRAPNLRAKMQYGRPTFQDDVYSLGLCILDALVPTELSSFNANANGKPRVGDTAFNPLSSELHGMLAKQDAVRGKAVQELISGMCNLDPSERPSLAEVVSQMTKLGEI